MENIQAIETTYNGTVFRSRLEARWALFFDKLGIKFLYEYEGYELPSGRYLPDFYLPELKTWVEIKPFTAFEKERTKCVELAAALRQDVILSCGPVGWWLDKNMEGAVHDHDESSGGEIFTSDGGGDSGYCPCVCPVCSRASFQFEGRGDRICVNYGCRNGVPGGRGHTEDHPLIVAAVNRANSHRFW